MTRHTTTRALPDPLLTRAAPSGGLQTGRLPLPDQPDADRGTEQMRREMTVIIDAVAMAQGELPLNWLGHDEPLSLPTELVHWPDMAPGPVDLRQRRHFPLAESGFGRLFGIYRPTLRALRERTKAGRRRPCAPTPATRPPAPPQGQRAMRPTRLRIRAHQRGAGLVRPRPQRGATTAHRPPALPLRYVFPILDPALSLEIYLEQFADREQAALVQLYRMWNGHNRRHFGGQLTTPFLYLSPYELDDGHVQYPAPLGLCSPHPDLPGRSRIGIRRDLADAVRRGRVDHGRRGRTVRRWWRMTSDVLLHECIHQAQHEIMRRREPRQEGHGPAFAYVCNRIGRTLGLEPVVYRQLAPERETDCRYWPHAPGRRPGTYPAEFFESGSAWVSPWIYRHPWTRDLRRRLRSSPKRDQTPDHRPPTKGPPHVC